MKALMSIVTVICLLIALVFLFPFVAVALEFNGIAIGVASAIFILIGAAGLYMTVRGLNA